MEEPNSSRKMMINIIFTLFVLNIYTSYSLPSRMREDEILEKCPDLGKSCDPIKTPFCCENHGICRQIGSSDTLKNITKCLEPAMVKESCNHDFECLWLDNAICNNEYNECECLPNYGILTKNGKCVLLIEGYCEIQADCKVPNTVCIDNKCQCREKFMKNSRNECKATVLGKKCQKDLDCSDIFHIGCSVDKKCVCKDNHILENNSTCVPLLDEFCWSDERCAVKHSICFDNKCRCKSGYTAITNTHCLKMKLWIPCQKHDDCNDTPHAECSFYGRCVCKEHYISVGTEFCRGRPNSMDAH